jgi:tetratricopeptide (TPR) repeat protein
MGRHLERALVLFHQSRLDLAEGELRQELAEDADQPQARGLLALCLAQGGHFVEAQREAERAVQQGPDLALAHYALATVLQGTDRLEEAEPAVQESLRLEPLNPAYFALQAGIRFQQRRWPAALEAAERGLAVDAAHTGCANLRALALVKLGRTGEARPWRGTRKMPSAMPTWGGSCWNRGSRPAPWSISAKRSSLIPAWSGPGPASWRRSRPGTWCTGRCCATSCG